LRDSWSAAEIHDEAHHPASEVKAVVDAVGDRAEVVRAAKFKSS
jgi:hypothetical protein